MDAAVNHKRQVRLWLLLPIWVALVVGGFGFIEIYQNKPGKPAIAPAVTPSKSKLPQLLVFLHPQCPCSRATVAELARIVALTKCRIETKAYVYSPREEGPKWAMTDIYQSARAIPEVSVELDTDGKVSRSFGVFTSGQVLLYSPEGRLVFSGGITATRGHEGDSDGKDAVINYVRTGKAGVKSTHVFGCSLGFEHT